MNTTPLEDEVHDALHRRVDPLQRSPLEISGVRRRARRIQRRRTAAAGAAVAAVLAVAVPVGLATNGAGQRSGIEPATPPSSAAVGTVRIDPRSAPTGDAPAVPLINVDEPSLVVDGTALPLPKPYDTLTPYMDGWVGVANDEGALSLEFLDQDFAVTDGAVPTGGLVTSPDGGHVAWSEYTGTHWQIVTSSIVGGTRWAYTTFPPGPQADEVRPVGFVSDDAVVAARTDATGRVTTFLADGSDPVELPGFLQPTSATPATGLVAGRIRSTGDSVCSAVIDVTSGAAAWETCNDVLGTFSPDGRYVVGFSPESDGYGSPALSVLDASTGERVVHFEVTPARNQVVAISDQAAWEDDETLVITLISGPQQYVVRLGVDGRVELPGGESTAVAPDTVPLRMAESR